MPPEPPPIAPPASDLPRRPGSRLRLVAALILVVGLLAAGAVWVDADDGAADTASGVRIVGGQAWPSTDSAAADLQTERLGGRALVRTVAFDRWLGSLWHGRRLAGVLAGLAIAAALLCRWIAGPAEPRSED